MIRSTGDEIVTLNCTFTLDIVYIEYLMRLLCCNIILRAEVSFWHRCLFGRAWLRSSVVNCHELRNVDGCTGITLSAKLG